MFYKHLANGRKKFGKASFVFIAALFLAPMMVSAQQIAIDLDRNTPSVDPSLVVPPSGGIVSIQGSVVITGADTDEAGIYAIEVQATNMTNPSATVINCPAEPTTAITAGDVTDGPPTTVVALCSANAFLRSSVFATPAMLGTDGVAALYNFDLDFACQDGETLQLSFTPTSSNAQIGVTINNVARTIGQGTSNQLPDQGATIICGQDGGSPTPEPPCEDAGYYILDAFGGRHAVGGPIAITGNLYYGRDVAEDMERFGTLVGNTKSVGADLAVVDTFGVVQFVVGAAPTQTFFWPEGSPPACGFAVDVEVTLDGAGFWVLTEGGGIYRAGTALPTGETAQVGNDAATLCSMFPLSFGGAVPRDPGQPAGDNASIRAVGFVVLPGASKGITSAGGFIVLDSQGGHFIFDADGNAFSDGVANSVANSDTAYPFFPGQDIGRDIELHPSGSATAGLVIYDGWGGVHPVPVTQTGGSQVAFLRNDPPSTSVGLPYIQTGFDNPDTPEDESDSATVGTDVGSIFKDIEFCSSGGGVYVMDGFGAVFAFGNTRAMADSPAPIFTGGPYFFPNIYARDLEPTNIVGILGR